MADDKATLNLLKDIRFWVAWGAIMLTFLSLSIWFGRGR